MNAVPMNRVVFDAVVVEEGFSFSFIQLCQACHSSDAQMRLLVDEGILNITMHPQVIGRGHRFLMLERLISWMKSHDSVQFTTLGAAADRFRAEHPIGS